MSTLQQQKLLGFILSDKTEPWVGTPLATVRPIKSTLTVKDTTIICGLSKQDEVKTTSAATTPVANTAARKCSRKTISKFDDFFESEPSLIRLYKASAVPLLDALVESGQSGAILVCGGTTSTTSTHVHNIAYAMAIFSVDALLQSMPKPNETDKPYTESHFTETESNYLNSPSVKDYDPQTHPTITMSWYSTLENDQVQGQFDQIDILAACKYSSITDSTNLPHSSSQTPRTAALHTPDQVLKSQENHQLLQLPVSTASSVQDIIKRVQQDPQLTTVLQSPNAHHAIVLRVHGPLNKQTDEFSSNFSFNSSVKSYNNSDERPIEFSFMWLSATLAGRMSADLEIGSRFFTSNDKNAAITSPFPHLRAMLRRNKNVAANSAMILALSGVPNQLENDQSSLRFANQYIFNHFNNQEQREHEASHDDGSPVARDGNFSPFPISLRRMLDDVGTGGAPATHWFTEVLKLLQKSRQGLRQLQAEAANLRTANIVLQQERDCAVDAITGRSSHDDIDRVSADQSSLLASLGEPEHHLSPSTTKDVHQQRNKKKHKIDLPSVDDGRNLQTDCVSTVDVNNTDTFDDDGKIDQRSMRNMIILLRSKLQTNVATIFEERKKRKKIQVELEELQQKLRKGRIFEKSDSRHSPSESTNTRALRTELVAQMHRTREMEATVQRLQNELSKEREYIKSEQRRFRRRVQLLKSDLSKSDAICTAAEDALLDQARNVPFSGIIVQPRQMGPHGVIPNIVTDAANLVHNLVSDSERETNKVSDDTKVANQDAQHSMRRPRQPTAYHQSGQSRKILTTARHHAIGVSFERSIREHT